MDRDDPAQRWGDDLERQPAEAVGQEWRDPERSPAAGRAEWALQNKWLSVPLAIFLFVGCPVFFFYKGAYATHAYDIGTPTTATDVHCVGRDQRCTGTWSVGEKLYTGSVVGACPVFGTCAWGSMDVHVHDGTAYTAHAGRRPFIFGATVISFPIALIGFAIVYSFALRRREAGS
jgi:hypothetical protein